MHTPSVYDHLAAGYLSPGRRSTTTVFRELQHAPIRELLQKVVHRGQYYSDMRYLIVGAGPLGNADELVHAHQLVGPYLDEMDPSHITYLDASSVVLAHCKEFVWGVVGKLFSGKQPGVFVGGFAETLGKSVPDGSQDVVLGALCDHFEPDDFFSSSMQVLKPGGVLITTYPADGINRVVRKRIYKIPTSRTRFVIDGEEHLVPSYLMTEARLRELYAQHGFEHVGTKAIVCGLHLPSETLKQAARLLNRPIELLPVLVAGIGYKPKA